MAIHRRDRKTGKVPLPPRIDTPIEVDYCEHGLRIHERSQAALCPGS